MLNRVARADRRRILCRVIALILICAGVAFAQTTATASLPTLSVGGEVGHPLVLHESDLAAMPRQSHKVTDEKGTTATYEGVPVFEVLQRAGAPLGKALRGKNLALYVLVTASDGYRAVFALPELDPAFTDRVVLLADRRDGHALDTHDGPLRIVVPGEKRNARWVHGAISLSVMRAN